MVVKLTWGGQGGHKDDDGVIGMAVPAAPVAVAAEEFELEDMIIIQKQTLTTCTLFYYIILKAIISTAVKRKKKTIKQFC